MHTQPLHPCQLLPFFLLFERFSFEFLNVPKKYEPSGSPIRVFGRETPCCKTMPLLEKPAAQGGVCICLPDGRQSMATSLLSMLLTSTSNLADVLTVIYAMEVAAARRHRARILGLLSV